MGCGLCGVECGVLGGEPYAGSSLPYESKHAGAICISRILIAGQAPPPHIGKPYRPRTEVLR